MHNAHWTAHEKKIACQIYDSALAHELASAIADFKRRAAAITDLRKYGSLNGICVIVGAKWMERTITAIRN